MKELLGIPRAIVLLEREVVVFEGVALESQD